MVRHLKDGESFFDGDSVGMHRDFGFSGSITQPNKPTPYAKGGGAEFNFDRPAEASASSIQAPSGPVGSYADEGRRRNSAPTPPSVTPAPARRRPAPKTFTDKSGWDDDVLPRTDRSGRDDPAAPAIDRSNFYSPNRSSADEAYGRGVDERGAAHGGHIVRTEMDANGGCVMHHAHGGRTHVHADGSMTRHPPGGMPSQGGHADEAQDRKLFGHMMAEHEGAEGKARGGPIVPRRMKPIAARRHSPIETPPRNPNTTTTPRNIMPGGKMAYGVEPSDEPDVAGSTQGIPQLRRGGRA